VCFGGSGLAGEAAIAGWAAGVAGFEADNLFCNHF